jgi:histidinol-phosphate aminotransferase
LHAALAGIPGVEVWPSEANFLLFRVDRDARALFDSLLSKGILIKCLHGAHPALVNCLRVTVGSPEQNAQFIAALTSLM